jgi:methionine-R-sulfoxide reductase
MNLIPLLALIACASCAAQGVGEFPGFPTSSPQREDKVVKTDAEWQKALTPEQFRILRKKGTEAAFCSPLLDTKEKGVFHCAGCDLPLFSTDTKFESGTGWPSFFQPITKDSIWLLEDRSYGMIRSEVLCARCDGHLGHVFTDGPKPTGLRFCMNGESLKFKANPKD